MKFVYALIVSYVVVMGLIVYFVQSDTSVKQIYHSEIDVYCRTEKPYGFNAKYGKEKCYELTEIVMEEVK